MGISAGRALWLRVKCFENQQQEKENCVKIEKKINFALL